MEPEPEDPEAMAEELREAFKFYDKEGNGFITTAVFKEILSELDDKLTSEELDMMIDEIDEDGSGTLDFDGNFNFHALSFELLNFFFLFQNSWLS